MDNCIETFIQSGKQSVRRFDGAIVELTRRGGLFRSAMSSRCSDVAGTCG